MTAALEVIDHLLARPTGRQEEEQLLDLVAGLSSDELNELLTDERADRLLDATDNHWFSARNHDALVELVAVRRAHELDLHARANLIYGLQKGFTSAADEAAVGDLFCAVTGEELTHFKNIINLRNDHHDLEALVFTDLESESVRERILSHIEEQARGLSLDESKILSDIDDTVFCKLHDDRFPDGTVYPGVLAFQEALDRGPSDDPRSLGDLTFVTARPMDFFGLLENHSRESLKKAGVADLSVMSGSLAHLLGHDAMASKKIENVQHYVQLYPEYRIVFVGDSGQGDVHVGERLWELFPHQVAGVFIHDVTGIDAQRRAAHAEHRICVFDTYVGAAARALQLGLLSTAGLRQVIEESLEEFDTITWSDEAQPDRVRELLDRDMAAARRLL
ncbi:phosphatase domain-containing protein [Luteococcus sp. Sow4_B9]|uniref:phosphatase domain-containing protein n=1 Tax=Luteococcus sp. Sow4_B9 TaxID=3438792 RepID=UPI003F9E6B01